MGSLVLALEAVAKTTRRGLWAEANPLPPWDWRHGGKIEKTPETAPATSDVAGHCGAKRTCREMTTCEEARFYLTQCGLSRLDGNRDGTPCEAVYR